VGQGVGNLSDLGNNNWTPVVAARQKRTLTPLLVVVFLASYGLMTMLIVEQGETIQSQKNLIQLLVGDSRELWALKGKAQAEKIAQNQAVARKQNQSSAEKSSTQAPSAKVPPTTNIPSNQVPQHPLQNRAGKTVKPENRIPQVPPVPASDLSDPRRVLITL
jgi:hypothetical protein